MNTTNHHKVVQLAIPALSAASRAFWGPRQNDITATCMFPDHYAIPLLNGEDGHWRPYFPAETPKHSFEKTGASARSHFFDIRFYVERIIGLMRQGDTGEACRFLGVLSHCLGDFGEPAHYYEREITLLLAPPPDRVNCNSHRMLEDIAGTVTSIDHKPMALGDTADTVIMRLEGRLRELYETTLASIVPMLSSIYRRDAAAARHSDVVVGATAAVMADLLHTFWGLHTEGWTDEEKKALSSCRLDTLEPAAYDVEFNYGCRPIRGGITLDQLGHALPLRLRIGCEGSAVSRDVEGLCVIPHALPLRGTQYLAALEFELPPKSFNGFSCTVGLLAGFEPQAPCRFILEGDGRRLFESPQVVAKDPALPISVDMTGVRRLRLQVSTDGSTDKLAMPIWAWPTLFR